MKAHHNRCIVMFGNDPLYKNGQCTQTIYSLHDHSNTKLYALDYFYLSQHLNCRRFITQSHIVITPLYFIIDIAVSLSHMHLFSGSQEKQNKTKSVDKKPKKSGCNKFVHVLSM